MKIVVIGGTGLIGTKVVAKLRSRGHQVIAASPNTGVNTITATASVGGKTYTDSCKWTLKLSGEDGKKGGERYQDPSINKYK